MSGSQCGWCNRVGQTLKLGLCKSCYEAISQKTEESKLNKRMQPGFKDKMASREYFKLKDRGRIC